MVGAGVAKGRTAAQAPCRNIVYIAPRVVPIAGVRGSPGPAPRSAPRMGCLPVGARSWRPSTSRRRVTQPASPLAFTLNIALIAPQVASWTAVCPHPTGQAPICPQSGLFSAAQGELQSSVKSPLSASQKSGSAQMLPSMPYCSSTQSSQSPPSLP